ncbi:type IV toxin-antitoxin system AbiEi family antitoxin domain-containing protein [Saxibacter everestensis]|uniref:Type IV toxin-antitoxin system AbiEi family antitoxin domain-containing protein n=1 Tax=Saxibacter everestensis TaxID=2909229 RepID=A0ABY8QQ11_9MICO|nr:type IV toxin-antitoxin system AbiEi family antitoxin domain-containing protein [Brevibacteriaceae bacterium ZFBP1038]
MDRTESSLGEGVAAMFAEQGGLVRAGQLELYGVDAKARRRWCRTRSLLRVRPGIYCLPSEWDRRKPWERYELQVRAVALRGIPSGSRHRAISHASAAVLWELPVYGRQVEVHVTSAGGRVRRDPVGVRTHHSLLVDAVTEIDGIPVTTLPRTIIDCCRAHSFVTGVAVADAGLRLLLDQQGVAPGDRKLAQETHREMLIAELDRRRLRGATQARKAIAFSDGRSESIAETRARIGFRAVGLPAPTPQFTVRTGIGTFYPDFVFEDYGVAVEIDGDQKYTELYTSDPFRTVQAERRRHNAIQEVGWEIVRVTWDDLKDPVGIKRRIVMARKRARPRGIA